MSYFTKKFDEIVYEGSPSNRRNSEASLLRCPDGRLMLVHTRFLDKGADHAPADLFVQYSEDGQHWGNGKVLLARKDYANVMAPGLVRLDAETIGITYIKKLDSNRAGLEFMRSTDNGNSWSDPVEITAMDCYTVSLNNTFIKTKAGRLIQPIYQTKTGGWVVDEHYKATCVFSDDLGRSWKQSESWVDCPGRGAMEPVIFEAGDEKLVMFLRTDQGWIYSAESQDGGESWTESSNTNIRSPQAPCMIITAGEGETGILCWNEKVVEGAQHGGPRNPLYLASCDLSNGYLNWENKFVLQESENDVRTFGYPSLYVEGNTLWISYYESSGKIALDCQGTKFISLRLACVEMQANEG